MTSASLIRRGDRTSILSASTLLSWILAAVTERREALEQIPCSLLHFAFGEVVQGTPLNAASTPNVKASASPDAVSMRYAKVLEAKASTAYPLDFLKGLPTKAAASKLQSDLLDRLRAQDDGSALEAQIELLQSGAQPFEAILQAERAPSATDIGSATHAFLEFCDFSALGTRSIAEEAARLASDGYISQKAAQILNQKHLEAFCRSELMQWITDAEEIRREQKFGILIPMSTLTNDAELKDTLREQKLFVQGSIDLLLKMRDGRLILIDYKTDRISEAERADPLLLQASMRQAHKNQLAAYEQAVTELFGKAPDETYVYSLPLGACIRI